jgi:tRNA-modifying protein YgfZ
MSTHLADHRDRGVVVVSGPDATSFLQSLVSQDLDPIPDGQGAPSLLLTPQGKLGITLRMLRVGDGWWLDCQAGFGEELAASLTRFCIRVDVTITDHTGSWDVLEVRGHEALARVGAAAHVDVPEPPDAHVGWGERRIVRSDWPGTLGVDVIGPTAAVHEARDELLHAGVAPFPPGAYEAARIEAGIVRLGIDVDEKTIPQEAFLERDAVSFTKGCFLGQELVCRIDTRGHVNRYLRLLRLADGTVPEAGDAVVLDDKVVGAVTSAAAVPDATEAVALAMVRHEVEPPAAAVVRSGGRDVSVVVEELPVPAG